MNAPSTGKLEWGSDPEALREAWTGSKAPATRAVLAASGGETEIEKTI